MTSTAARGWAIGALVAVLLAVIGVLGLSAGRFGGGLGSTTGDGDTTSGMVVRHEGRDYWVSDYYVAPSVLRATLALDQPFMDTTVDLRAIEGQDPSVTMAAYTPRLSQASPTAGWHLVSTDAAYWTDEANVRANASLFAPPP